MGSGMKTEVGEIIVFLIHIFASVLAAFVRNIFFFLPRKYKNITGDVILITGGGKGIGRLIAVEFAKRRPKQVGHNLLEHSDSDWCSAARNLISKCSA